MQDMNLVVWTVYDSCKKQLYKGTNSEKARRLAKRGGFRILRNYFFDGISVNVKSHLYIDGKDMGSELYSFSEEEINILNEALRGK